VTVESELTALLAEPDKLLVAVEREPTALLVEPESESRRDWPVERALLVELDKTLSDTTAVERPVDRVVTLPQTLLILPSRRATCELVEVLSDPKVAALGLAVLERRDLVREDNFMVRIFFLRVKSVYVFGFSRTCPICFRQLVLYIDFQKLVKKKIGGG
jgi:hypothetical protein